MKIKKVKLVSSKKKYRTAWGLLGGPRVDKQINLIPKIKSFPGDNDFN